MSQARILGERFGRFLAERGCGGKEEAAQLGRLLWLFVLALQTDLAPADAVSLAGERAARLQELFARLFANPVKTSPLSFVLRGLSFLNYLDEQPFARPAVEIGCASGVISAQLFEEPFDARVDVDVVAVDQRLAFADASIATVVLDNALFHAGSRDRLLAEILRVLQPGGSVLFDDLTPAMVDSTNHPLLPFIHDAGARELAHQIGRSRLEGRSPQRPIDVAELLHGDRYPAYLASLGFRDVRAREFCSPHLTRVGYATHDVEYAFGLDEPEITPWYRAWIEEVLAPAILADRTVSAQTGGAFVFVKART